MDDAHLLPTNIPKKEMFTGRSIPQLGNSYILSPQHAHPGLLNKHVFKAINKVPSADIQIFHRPRNPSSTGSKMGTIRRTPAKSAPHTHKVQVQVQVPPRFLATG